MILLLFYCKSRKGFTFFETIGVSANARFKLGKTRKFSWARETVVYFQVIGLLFYSQVKKLTFTEEERLFILFCFVILSKGCSVIFFSKSYVSNIYSFFVYKLNFEVTIGGYDFFFYIHPGILFILYNMYNYNITT